MKTVTTEAASRARLSFSAHLVMKKETDSFNSSYSDTATGKEREVVIDFFAGGAVSSGRQLTPRSSITRRAPTTVMLLRALRWGRAESDELQGVVTDLSVGGCFVESDERVYDGDLVKLGIDIPENGVLTIWGNVVFWVRETGFGVRFVAFSQGGARDELARILDEEGRRS
jgi:hypothetical protein